MKIFLITLGIFCCLLTSCKTEEMDSVSTTPDCVQAIIDDLQENDTNASCSASIKRYSFENTAVFEVQTDACVDGPITIIDANCDTICMIASGLIGVFECGNSNNFYDEAVLIEVVWSE